jgi:hypothetical protein
MGGTPPVVRAGATKGSDAVSGEGSTGKLGQFFAWLGGVREKYPLLDKLLGALSDALSKILGAAVGRGVNEFSRGVGIAVKAIADSTLQGTSSTLALKATPPATPTDLSSVS